MAKKISYREACQNLEQLCDDAIASGTAIEIITTTQAYNQQN